MIPSIHILIPAFNEAGALAGTLSKFLSLPYEVVVIDDGSTDETSRIVQNFPVTYLRHPLNLGQGAALQTGMAYAITKGADLVVHFDADGQHLPEEINSLLAPLLEGRADITLGSRFLSGSSKVPPGKRLLLQSARWVNWMFTGLLLSDAHNGFRAFNRKALEAIMITENRMAHATEILQQIKQKNLRYMEVPVTIVYSDYSRRKGQHGWNAINILFNLLYKKIDR